MEFAHLATREPTVSLGSPLDVKEQVKQAIDIVELVGSYVQLRRQGRNFVALCPWHDDSRPSLTVNPERQSYKCWVCNLGGDVFSFVMQMEGITFPEALAMLAERAGIALKPVAPTVAAGPCGQSFDKRILFRAMAWTEQQYHRCLLELPEGEPGRKYFQERGITAESIAKFHLGFCPDQWDWIVRQAQNKGPGEKLLEAIGVLVRSANTGRAYDRFKGRAMFTIHDSQGRSIGVGGRILPEAAATNPAKYVNSPETPLFHKSSNLYGLDVARDAIRRSRQVMVMEGYTDCIMAHQYGFQDAVAVLGTALGEGHLKILKRFADRIILVLDGDEAGQKRTNEVLELFIAQQIDLRILTLPEEADPCEFLQEHGAEAFAELLATRTVDALEHAFQSATRGVDLNRDVHAASQAVERLLAIIAKGPRAADDTTSENRLREQKMMQRLAASFRLDERDLRERLTELRRKARQKPGPAAPAPMEAEAAPEMIDAWQRSLLEALLRFPQFIARAQVAIDPEHLDSPRCRRIYEACGRLQTAGMEDLFSRLMLEFDDAATKSLLVELDEEGRAKAERVLEPETLFKELMLGFQRREAQKQRPAQVVALRDGRLDESQQADLLRQILEQARARQGISAPMDG